MRPKPLLLRSQTRQSTSWRRSQLKRPPRSGGAFVTLPQLRCRWHRLTCLKRLRALVSACACNRCTKRGMSLCRGAARWMAGRWCHRAGATAVSGWHGSTLAPVGYVASSLLSRARRLVWCGYSIHWVWSPSAEPHDLRVSSTPGVALRGHSRRLRHYLAADPALMVRSAEAPELSAHRSLGHG